MLAGNIPGRTQTMSIAVYTAVQSGNRELAYRWTFVICLLSFAAMFAMNAINSRFRKRNIKRGGI
jgi:molybdate transport system permease protein